MVGLDSVPYAVDRANPVAYGRAYASHRELCPGMCGVAEERVLCARFFLLQALELKARLIAAPAPGMQL